jgi:hypothetical protein
MTPAAGMFVSFTANGRPFFIHEELIADGSDALKQVFGK